MINSLYDNYYMTKLPPPHLKHNIVRKLPNQLTLNLHTKYVGTFSLMLSHYTVTLYSAGMAAEG